MAYKVIFTTPDGDMLAECILDSIPSVGDDVQIIHYDSSGDPSGKVDTFPVLHRVFAYFKMDRPGLSTLDSQMHLASVHITLGLASY